ncbi:MAG: CDP-diacylglycerol--serine O-phosphatidyltransferase [Bacteroidaceae bacterium]|nr:CDP-diacylglycerol--serine O-phosphatidyltransferase [Bacteroidaceae bacterium]
MANCITRHIPNAVTCCNLFAGCIASVYALQGDYQTAILFIILGAVFDFFDGMLARLLDARSPIGKDLDSLADDVSFGFAPAAIVFSLFKEVRVPEFMSGIADIIPYTAFLIAVFSALRLAKFNIDPRQTTSFIGLPTPANALFWGSLVVGGYDFLVSEDFNALYLLGLVALTSWLLVAEIPMFSLKFKNLSWSDNKIRFLFLLGCLPLILVLGLGSLAAIIIWYAFLSLLAIRGK